MTVAWVAGYQDMVVLLAKMRDVDLRHGIVGQKQDLGLAFQRTT